MAALDTSTLFSINGRIVPEDRAVIPVTDRGFLYGDGVFETIHAYGHTPFRLRDHLRRLAHGMQVLQFRPTPSPANLRRWVIAAVRAAGFSEANVRLTVTRGSGPRGPSLRGSFRPFTVITVTRFQRRPERDYRRGVKAVWASFRRQESSVLSGLKTTAYIEQILARQEADRAGADEALLLNNAGLLCEGSASNLTLVREGRLLAPDPQLSGCLPGTMQEAVFELARSLTIPASFAALGPGELRECEEAFLTGSMREITPLVQVGGTRIGNGRPGSLTRRLIGAYRKRVERECPGYRF